MTDLEPILTLWQELRDSGAEYVLASIVDVEGSGYRKPGAMMVVAADGRKVGTISGGCLEAEVAKKAFWHTENGPVVRPYSTSAEDGDVPFGMGCGGVVHLLLERSGTALPFLERLAAAFRERQALAVATVLSGDAIGRRAFWPDPGGGSTGLAEAAEKSYREQHSLTRTLPGTDGKALRVRAEFRAARPGLFVFGAGDDAMPLVRQAKNLGWYVVVADGRSHLATRARFPEAHEVHVVGAKGEFPLRLLPTDAAAILTHSLEQDTYFLQNLLGQELAYLGVLGPVKRTRDMLETIAAESGLEAAGAASEEWQRRVHAPMGLDLGGDTPAEIALAIVAEIQLTVRQASGEALKVVRGRQRSRPVEAFPVSAD